MVGVATKHAVIMLYLGQGAGGGGGYCSIVYIFSYEIQSDLSYLFVLSGRV